MLLNRNLVKKLSNLKLFLVITKVVVKRKMSEDENKEDESDEVGSSDRSDEDESKDESE